MARLIVVYLVYKAVNYGWVYTLLVIIIHLSLVLIHVCTYSCLSPSGETSYRRYWEESSRLTVKNKCGKSVVVYFKVAFLRLLLSVRAFLLEKLLLLVQPLLRLIIVSRQSTPGSIEDRTRSADIRHTTETIPSPEKSFPDQEFDTEEEIPDTELFSENEYLPPGMCYQSYCHTVIHTTVQIRNAG